MFLCIYLKRILLCIHMNNKTGMSIEKLIIYQLIIAL